MSNDQIRLIRLPVAPTQKLPSMSTSQPLKQITRNSTNLISNCTRCGPTPARQLRGLRIRWISSSLQACDPNRSSSRTAFQQREILDQLRSSQASSSSNGIQARVVDPNRNANEALRALSSGGMSSSMLGDASLRMNKKGLTSRMTAEGKAWKDIGTGQKGE